VAVVNSYFDAITSHEGSVALTHPGCGRAENGTPAPAGRFLPPVLPVAAPAAAAPPPAAANAPANDCVSGLSNFNLSMVVARRIPLLHARLSARNCLKQIDGSARPQELRS
jgi:hypothetical protein